MQNRSEMPRRTTNRPPVARGLVFFAWLIGVCAAFFFILAVPGTAAANGERVHGLVLAVTLKDGEAVVRHNAFGAMPAMTMSFRILPRSELGTLQPGNTIDATVDTAADPWTLRDVKVSALQAVETDTAPLRQVKLLKIGDVIPDVPLFDQAGRPFRFSDLRGKDTVLSFIYTRCHDPRMCPLISAKFHGLQQRIGTRAMHLVEVTLDPSYDRPPILARYGKTFGADPKYWTLAVGDTQATLDFAARFGITNFPDRKLGIIHDENTVEIAPDGRIRSMITTTSWQPDEIIADIDNSRGEASNPLERFNLWLSHAAVAMCGNRVGSFSGLSDLAISLFVIGLGTYVLFRVARGIFAKSA
ncbi:MAG TPA: SCO family protein [Candidatus Aquilonibacter sp.]